MFLSKFLIAQAIWKKPRLRGSFSTKQIILRIPCRPYNHKLFRETAIILFECKWGNDRNSPIQLERKVSKGPIKMLGNAEFFISNRKNVHEMQQLFLQSLVIFALQNCSYFFDLLKTHNINGIPKNLTISFSLHVFILTASCDSCFCRRLSRVLR